MNFEIKKFQKLFMVNKRNKKDKEENGNIKSNIFPFALIFVKLIYTRIHLENELTTIQGYAQARYSVSRMVYGEVGTSHKVII